jgi:hypothetical protein
MARWGGDLRRAWMGWMEDYQSDAWLTDGTAPVASLWRGDLSPFGCIAVANPEHTVYLMHRVA